MNAIDDNIDADVLATLETHSTPALSFFFGVRLAGKRVHTVHFRRCGKRKQACSALTFSDAPRKGLEDGALLGKLPGSLHGKIEPSLEGQLFLRAFGQRNS